MVDPFSCNIIFVSQVYIVLQDIESINKTEKQHYEHRFLLTVDMMYRKLAKALHETNIQGILFEILPCLCCCTCLFIIDFILPGTDNNRFLNYRTHAGRLPHVL